MITSTCQPPTSPLESTMTEQPMTRVPRLGRDLHASHYAYRPFSFLHANHGSFGTAPDVVLARVNEFRSRWLDNPDGLWFDIEEEFTKARQAVAKDVLACPLDNLTLVDNATTGALIVSRKIGFDALEALKTGKPRPIVMLSNSTYGGVKLGFQSYAEAMGAEIVYWTCPFPVYSAAEIVNAFRTRLAQLVSQGKRPSLVAFDHVVSENALVMPLEELVKEARAGGVPEIFVDGAHAPGQIDLLGFPQRLGIDYYTGNLHKWMCGAGGCALFYFARGEKELRHPLTSWNHAQGLIKESWMLATRDYAPLLSAPTAVNFYTNALGPERVREHVKSEAWKAGNMLKEMWGTKIGGTAELFVGMVMVLLPPGIDKAVGGEPVELRKRLRKAGCEIQTPIVVDGQWWLRISVPAWMEASEFGKLGQMVLQVTGGGRL